MFLLFAVPWNASFFPHKKTKSKAVSFFYCDTLLFVQIWFNKRLQTHPHGKLAFVKSFEKLVLLLRN